MNARKTEEYYRNLGPDAVCGCVYCRNYVRNIRRAYPVLCGFLARCGIDAEKPLETMPLEPREGYITYIGTQYVVLGSAGGFRETAAGGVGIAIAGSHPETELGEEHFVLELDEIRLPWKEEGERRERS
ncbi:MAG: hypothetical protein IJM21_03070 [Clostridia bacterium]|nr:hypothetical protein [Clostridia bacterium]